ncbi:MAG: AAA family ATPase [Pyrinomonadaceae bacterium]|nr:AAA family ATPase [Pyrinomonadaceae bacterium]
MKHLPLIVIMGFMGAGKSTFARALARRLDCQMLDLDEIIAEQEKRSVPELIEREGEEQFRRAETLALQIVLERKTARIIALGGGAWTLERNRALIAKHECYTVWLDAPFELCWKRIASEQQLRPLAIDRKTTHALYDERRQCYKLAMLHVPVTENSSADELAFVIVKSLRQRFAKR